MPRGLRLKSIVAKGGKVSALETDEQQAVIKWWTSYCKTRGLPEFLLFSIPNGSVLAGDARHRAIQMARLKREGLRAGCPDLFLAAPKIDKDFVPASALFFGLFIEMKRIGETPNENQRAFHSVLRFQGYNVIVAQGADEAIRALKVYCET